MSVEKIDSIRFCETRRAPVLLDVVGVAGLVALGAWVRIYLPFSPVPVTLQTLPVLVAGFAVGWRRATAGIMLYLAAGLAGAPLFAVSYGATFGYLAAFVFTPWLVTRYRSAGYGLAAGTCLIYVLGAGWLWLWPGCPVWHAVLTGVIPFIPGDVIKALVAHRVIKWLGR